MLRRFAVVRQSDQGDCGAAGPATIALHHRVAIDRKRMRDLAGAGGDLRGPVRAAEALGFSARMIGATYEALARLPLPAVASVQAEGGTDHLVVVHRVLNDSVVVADPARGIREMPRPEFCGSWAGHLLIVVPAQGPDRPGAGDASAGPWRRLLGLLRPHAPVLIEAFLAFLERADKKQR
jgi:ABC-type bacteriocin/lantibiotic exporter with double-glycine peptidase domain